jgi:hypothetical protein
MSDSKYNKDWVAQFNVNKGKVITKEDIDNIVVPESLLNKLSELNNPTMEKRTVKHNEFGRYTKEALITVGFALLYYIAGGLIKYLITFLFIWMAHWSWLFIFLFTLLGGITIVTGIYFLNAMLVVALSRNIVGRILSILITLYFSYTSIYYMWVADFFSSPDKMLAVKIISTVVFAGVYLPSLIASIFPSYKD